MSDEVGMQITSVMRNKLSRYTDLDWVEVCEIVEKFQEDLLNTDWLSDDYGRTYQLSFVPKPK